MQKISKQLSFIGSNFLSGKYDSVDELKRVQKSVVNASNMACRANSMLLSYASCKKNLKAILDEDNAENIDEALESSAGVAMQSAMLNKAIADEIEELEPSDTIEDDEEPVETTSDEILDDEVDETAPVESSEDNTETEPVTDDIVEDKDEDEEVETTSSADEVEDAFGDTDGDDPEDIPVADPIVSKRAATKTRKQSVIKKASKGNNVVGISWGMPSLPESKRIR